MHGHVVLFLFLNKEARNTHWPRAGEAASINDAGQTGYLHVEECKKIHTVHHVQNSLLNGTETLT